MDILTLIRSYVEGLLDAEDRFIEHLDSFPELEETVVRLTNQMAAGFLSAVLTTADALICDSGIRRKEYTVQRKRRRTLISSVGDVTFTHTLYKDQKGQIRCLLDDQIRLPDRERFTTLAEAKVLSEAEVHSYQHAADSVRTGAQTITKTTVMNKIHAIEKDLPEAGPVPRPEEKKRVEYLYLFPMCFEEFLMALGEETALGFYRQTPVPSLAHDKLSRLFRLYSFIGGMPEAVSRYVETRDLSQLSPVYSSLLTAYKDDVSKYASTTHEGDVIRHVIETAPKESGNRITFEKFGNSGYRSVDVGNSMRKLERAMLLYLRYPVKQYELPIYPDKKLRPRLQVLDSGLINYSLGIQALYFQDIKLSDVYRGTLAEQMVWQELLCQSSRELNVPTFWVKEKKQSNAEIDFMISWQGHMLPTEVKSGKDGTLRSLHQFIDNGGEPFAIRLYDQQYSLLETQTPEKDGVPGHPYRLLNLPLYCAGKIPAYLELLYK